jgi:hypothetical protein
MFCECVRTGRECGFSHVVRLECRWFARRLTHATRAFFQTEVDVFWVLECIVYGDDMRMIHHALDLDLGIQLSSFRKPSANHHHPSPKTS